MKSIKIKFTDIPLSSFGYEKNWITRTLKERYDVEICEANPDFLFFGIFGYDNLNYQDCVKVFFTGEAAVPDFNICDYAFSFNYIDFKNRHIRAIVGDLVADTISTIKQNIQDRSSVSEDMARRKFCNFIYSQDKMGRGAKLRKDFCIELMKYKHVDCPGLVLNNMPKGAIAERWKSGKYSCENVTNSWNQGKLDFLRNYKFTIAFENLLLDGYTTEKLIHPLMAYSIPIYWGNPVVTKDFNPKAFINCNEYSNLEAVIQRVKELDNDDEQYLEMLRQPPMQEDFNFKSEEKAKEFLYQIIERGKYPFDKDPLSCSVTNQMHQDIHTAWTIITALRANEPEKALQNIQHPETKKMIEELEGSTTLRISRCLTKFFNTQFGGMCKKILKFIFTCAFKISDTLKKRTK